jgi:hypothetical protein
MDATRTRHTARRARPSIGVIRHDGSGDRYGPQPTPGADAVIRRVNSGEPMTLAELQRAFAVLGGYVRAGRMDVLVARVRIAVRLEELGA